MTKTIKVAAIQLAAKLGDVDYNLKRASILVDQAFETGANWVLLPEFFPTAVAFHSCMDNLAQPMSGTAFNLLKEKAKQHNGFVGGSFICEENGDNYNRFVLMEPSGNYTYHDKDLPTFWENCYYKGGSDDGVLKTTNHRVGSILCWEFIRWQTANRLKGQIDFVLGASCWTSFPNRKVYEKPDKMAAEMMAQSIPNMAKILGVPVVHAAHAGNFVGKTPYLGSDYRAHFLGETQIVDATGNIVARLSQKDGEGIISAEVTLGEVVQTIPLVKNKFWIPPMPGALKLCWALFNRHGRKQYKIRRKFKQQKAA